MKVQIDEQRFVIEQLKNTTSRPGHRRYCFASGFQVRMIVIGAAPPSTSVLIRKRPSEATSSRVRRTHRARMRRWSSVSIVGR